MFFVNLQTKNCAGYKIHKIADKLKFWTRMFAPQFISLNLIV